MSNLLPHVSNPDPLGRVIVLPGGLQSSSVASLLGRLSLPPASAPALPVHTPDLSRLMALQQTATMANPLVQQWITNQIVQELSTLQMQSQNQLQLLRSGPSITITGPVLPPGPSQGHVTHPRTMASSSSDASSQILTSGIRGMPSITTEFNGMGATSSRVHFPSQQTAGTGNALSDGIPLSLSMDKANLSEFQCLVRDQIHLFAATQIDIDTSAQGRNRPIVVQQVGIRCRHCAQLPSAQRPRGAVYFPSKLSGLYQAAQNMTLNHFLTSCQSMPGPLQAKLVELKKKKTYVLGGGKSYWARGGRIKNIIEIDGRLFFENQVPPGIKDHFNLSNGT
jgi:hypothetical protein